MCFYFVKETNEKLNIYPNPAKNHLKIDYSNKNNYSMNIYSLSGSLIKKYKFAESSNYKHSSAAGIILQKLYVRKKLKGKACHRIASEIVLFFFCGAKTKPTEIIVFLPL